MSAEAEKIVNELCKSFESKDLDKIMPFFAEDAVYHNMPIEPVKGTAAIRETIDNYLNMASRVEFKILKTASVGDVVFNERIDMFDIGLEPKRIELPVAGVFEVRNGKITLWRDYFDIQSFTRHLS